MTAPGLRHDRQRLRRDQPEAVACGSCAATLDLQAERPADAGWQRELPGRESAWGAGGAARWTCPDCQRRRAENHTLEEWA